MILKEFISVTLGANLTTRPNEEIQREAWTTPHRGDRSSLDLMGRQNDLAEAMLATGKPVVAVLLNGGPMAVNRLADKASAVLEAWYNGQETGAGIAHILTGRVNPGGKLAISIPRSAGQLPVYYNRKPTARRSYVDGDTTPLYPFGFGLSYTTFDISAPRAADTPAGRPVTVEVDVRNTGSRDGDEVVQLYIHHPLASVTLPVRELKGFARVSLKAGEGRTVRFVLGAWELGYWNAAMQFAVEPGRYELMAGNSSAEVKTTALNLI